MGDGSQRLTKLSAKVQAQICASVQISSLSQVILELVKNSLDADAENITIWFDFSKGYCSVLDDGQGISADEFGDNGGLAQLYYTSRIEKPRRWHGKYGRFLSSLSAVSLLSITSCRTSSSTVSSAVFRDGKRLSANMNTTDESLGAGKSGSRVVVHDLFRNMPVRVKSRLNRLENHSELDKEFRALRVSLAALVLATPRSFSMDIRSRKFRYTHRPAVQLDRAEPDIQPLDLNHVASTFYQAGLIASPASTLWKQATTHTHLLSLQAAISLQPAPSKAAQFICLNQHPLAADHFKLFFDQINSLFDSSSFGAGRGNHLDSDEHELWHQHRQHQQNAPAKQIFERGKRVDRWPVFYIRIGLKSSSEIETMPDSNADRIITLTADILHTLVAEFLHSNGFRVPSEARKRNRRKRKRSLATEICDTSVQNQGFSSWSRVKSANGTPKDFLTGLPFMLPKRTESRPVNDLSNHKPASSEIRSGALPDVEEIEWTNPQTRNKLRIDPRTGTTLPAVDGIAPSVFLDAARRPTCGSVRNVADTLRSKALLRGKAEDALKSITSGYDVSLINDQRGLDCGGANALQGAVPFFVGNSKSGVDSVCTSITREMLQTANALGQVDGKFILASAQSTDVSDMDPNAMLILIDQHAADERVKVENLFRQLCSSTAIPLACPVVFEIDREETQRFKQSQAFFASWNVEYMIVSSEEANQMRVLALPEVIAERCRLEPRLLVELLRKEIWQDRRTSAARQTAKVDDWLTQIGDCPQGLLDVLTSRACRSAIMFNDALSVEECRRLISQLGDCLFPFQCAHGRPSLTAIARIRDVGTQEIRIKDSTFGQAWKAWMSE